MYIFTAVIFKVENQISTNLFQKIGSFLKDVFFHFKW